MDVQMEEIRDPGPRDRDRKGQEPVGERPVAARGELQQQPHQDHEHLDAAALEIAVGLEIVRRGLPARSRQDLHDPEDEDDFRNLCRNRSGKEATNQRDQAVL